MITPQTFTHLSASIQAGLLDPQGLLEGFGAWAFFAALVILFLECGVIFAAILPGDSLLFIVGLLIANGTIGTPLPIAILAMFLAAFAGNVFGYWTGAKIGPRLFNRPDSKIFKKEFVTSTHDFFDKHGTRAIVLARFVPIVRSFITSVAGIAGMNRKVFITYSAIGAAVWVGSLTLAGYFLGSIEIIKSNIEMVAIGIVLLSVVPIAVEAIRHRRKN